MDVTMFKPRRSRAKNEVHMPFDITIVEILTPAINQNRVLPAEETAVAERGAVTIHANRQGLPDRPGGVGKRDVFRRKIVGVNRRGRRFERAERFAIQIGHGSIQAEGEDGVGGIIANEAKVCFLTLHIHQLVIHAGFDMNDDRVDGAAGRYRHDGRLDAFELAGTIGGNGDVRLRAQRRGGKNRCRNDQKWFHVMTVLWQKQA